MNYEQIIDMTTVEFWTWFWQPYGVAELVSLRKRLGDDLICQLVQSDWFNCLSQSDQDWFWNSVGCIIDEQLAN